MEQLKTIHDTVGDGISNVLAPSFKAFTPLLLKKKNSILEISPKTSSYGGHPRQKLDFYASTSSESPILVFLYGGGLTRGDKILPGIPDGLIYHNLGTFFAKRGISTFVVDYRRVNSEAGGEGAVFPSGGEDLAAALNYIETLYPDGKHDIVVMGNSAGSVHLSTFMLDPSFQSQRASLTSGSHNIVWKGAICLSMPAHFDTALPNRLRTLNIYYGSEEETKAKSPYGLLETAVKGEKDNAGVPQTLMLVGEWDPEDEIAGPMRDFVRLWEQSWGKGVELRKVPGHNHISPPLALMSGEGEEWGEDVAAWIKGFSSSGGTS